MERSIIFETFEEFNQGCDSISFSFDSDKESEFIIMMNFSNMVGGTNNNLELKFPSIIAMKYEQEMPGLIPIPEVPKCTNKYFSEYIYPTVVVENSTWAKEYELYRESLTHYVFISLNDILHVLSEKQPILSGVLGAENNQDFEEVLNSLCSKVVKNEILLVEAVHEIMSYPMVRHHQYYSVLNSIYNETIHLPIGENRKFWSKAALDKKKVEIEKSEIDARRSALHICEKIGKAI